MQASKQSSLPYSHTQDLRPTEQTFTSPPPAVQKILACLTPFECRCPTNRDKANEATSACNPSHVNSAQQQTMEQPTLTTPLHRYIPPLLLWERARRGGKNTHKKTFFLLPQTGWKCLFYQPGRIRREGEKASSIGPPLQNSPPRDPGNKEALAVGVECATFSCAHCSRSDKAPECRVELRQWK